MDNGRTSAPPSLLATALLLQTHDKVDDAEARARATFLPAVESGGRAPVGATRPVGVRKAGYFGRAKTKFRLYLAATLGNMTLFTDKLSVASDPDPASRIHQRRRGWHHSERQSPRRPVAHPATAWLTKTAQSKWAFRQNSREQVR